MSKKKTIEEKIETKINKKEVQKILSYWHENPSEWIQYKDLRNEFVKKYSKIIYQPSLERYYNPSTGKKYDNKPESLYKHESGFTRELGELVKLDILKKKEISQEKGKPNVYYKPSKNYKIEIFRAGQKETLNSFSTDNLIIYDVPNIPPTATTSYIQKDIIGGFSDHIFKEMNKEEKERYAHLLNNIDYYLNSLENMRVEVMIRRLGELVISLEKSLKNKKLKKLIKKDKHIFSTIVYPNLLFAYEDGIDINSLSKKDFFKLFYIGSDKKNDLIESKEANKSWSKFFFKKTWRNGKYRYSKTNIDLDDIFCILNWAYKNRALFTKFMPLGIFFSRYNLIGSSRDLIEKV